MAKAGKLAGVTVINELFWANELATYVPIVVYRVVQSDHDEQGKPFVEYGADPRVIYQFDNEWNNPNDCERQIRLMQDADAHRRKVVICNDSVGWTEDSTWFTRRRALEYARDHGHYVGLHAYGDVSGGYHPAMAWDSPGAYRWFAGRFEHLYSLMPEVQPKLILTEWGAGSYQKDAGADNWNRDRREMDRRAATLPYLISFHAWTAGCKSPSLGFTRDSLDDWLAAV